MNLTFNTEQKAIDAERQIWINYVKSQFNINKNIIGTGNVEYDSLDGLTDNEISNLVVYGIIKNEISKNEGVTTSYVLIKKAYQSEKWYFEKPLEELMIGVVDYTEEEYSIEWQEPFD